MAPRKGPEHDEFTLVEIVDIDTEKIKKRYRCNHCHNSWAYSSNPQRLRNHLLQCKMHPKLQTQIKTAQPKVVKVSMSSGKPHTLFNIGVNTRDPRALKAQAATLEDIAAKNRKRARDIEKNRQVRAWSNDSRISRSEENNDNSAGDNSVGDE